MGALLGMPPRVHRVPGALDNLVGPSGLTHKHCHPLPPFAYFLLGWNIPGKQGLRSRKKRQERVMGTQRMLDYRHPRIFKRQIKEESYPV